jgi:hypothetical protein
MKIFTLLALILFTVFMGLMCGCKKDESHDQSNTDSLDLAHAAYKQKLKAFLDSVTGNYSVTKRTTHYCPGCPQPFQVKDSIYLGAYILTVSAIADSILGISVNDTSGNYSGQQYFFTSQLDCCPPLDENLEYDPEIRFNVKDPLPHGYHHVLFYPNDSIYVTSQSGGLGGSSYTYYYGTKIP